MTKILPIGTVLTTDEEGYLVNNSNSSLIQTPWKETLNEMVNAYTTHLQKLVHSVYIRGSLAKGEAIEGVSDIDTYAVIREHPNEIDQSWIAPKRLQLSSRYPFVTKFDFMFIPLQGLLESSDETFKSRFMIKVQSACIR